MRDSCDFVVPHGWPDLVLVAVTGLVLSLSATPAPLSGQGKPVHSVTGGGDWVVTDSYAAYVSPSLEHRIYVNWDEVSSAYAGVAEHSAKSQSNGPGLWAGIQIPRVPVIPMIGGYYAGGLVADATLDNGRRVHNEVTDYGLGVGLRFAPLRHRRVSPWAHFAAIYQMNRATYEEFSASNSLILSEKRSHSSWTGSYGFGATYWVSPTFGIEAGLSYSTRFKRLDADNAAVLAGGFVYRGWIP